MSRGSQLVLLKSRLCIFQLTFYFLARIGYSSGRGSKVLSFSWLSIAKRRLRRIGLEASSRIGHTEICRIGIVKRTVRIKCESY
jgi:hypothetical protein